MKLLPPSRNNVDLIDVTLSGGAYDDVVAFVMTWRHLVMTYWSL